jgi:hypothetical protein
MKDFDFDEIDRAVNSVSSGDIKASDKPDDALVEPPKPESTPEKTTPALAGRRSSGQFMDVVHPSSNMRRAPMKMPTLPTNPINQNPTPEKSPVEPAQPISSEDDTKPVETELPTPTIESNVWDDMKTENDDADIDKISDDITNEMSHKPDELPDTPFIAGTKVEKRPLGAFSTESPTSDPNPENADELIENKDKSLPDELQDKLLSIESNESKPELEPAGPDEKPIVTPVVEKPAADKQPTGATSITQQYEEKPSTGDRDSGPIYDTNSYHKPIIPPAKKKSGWMWVIWILVLIIIGVGVGILVNNYVLPNL